MRSLLPITWLVLASISFGSDEDCSDAAKLGNISVPAPQILKIDVGSNKSTIHLNVPKMSNGANPARIQILATETPWAEHGQDCFLRSKERERTCQIWDYKSANNAFTFPELPGNKRHSYFVRSLACTSDSIDYGSGWGRGKNGAEIVRNPADTTLKAFSLGHRVMGITFSIPTTSISSTKLQITSEEKLGTSTPGWQLIGFQNTNNQIVHTEVIGNLTRFQIFLLPTAFVSDNDNNRWVVRLQEKKEVAFALRPNFDFDHMVASLVMALDASAPGTFWPQTEKVWNTMDAKTWLEMADLLYRNQTLPSVYDDILVAIMDTWGNVSASTRKSKLEAIVASFDGRAQEELVRLNFHRGSSILRNARNFVRLQFLGNSLANLWKPGRMLQLYRGAKKTQPLLPIEKAFDPTSTSTSRVYYPQINSSTGVDPVLDTIKGMLDTGMVLTPTTLASYGMKARFIPAYFDAPRATQAEVDDAQISKLQFVDVIDVAVLGDELMDGKRLPGILILQPKAPSKVFELKKPVYSYRAEILGSTNCATKIQASLETASALPTLRLSANAPMTAAEKCQIKLTELDASSKPVLSLQSDIIASSLFFTGFPVSKSILVTRTTIVPTPPQNPQDFDVKEDINLQVHPDIWNGKFGKATVTVNLKDDYFQVLKDNGTNPVSEPMTFTKDLTPPVNPQDPTFSDIFTLLAKNGGKTDLEAILQVEGRQEPVLRQTLGISSVQIKANLNQKTGAGNYLYQQLPLQLEFTPRPTDNRTWEIRTKLVRKNGQVFADFGSLNQVESKLVLAPGSTQTSLTLNVTPVLNQESTEKDDHKLYTEYGYTENSQWHALAKDSITFTVANCLSSASQVSFRSISGNYRYIFSSFQPAQIEPDAKGYCSYVSQQGQLDMRTFDLKDVGTLSNSQFSILANVSTQAIGDQPTSIIADGNLTGTFQFGPSTKYTGTMNTLHLEESIGSNGSIGNLVGGLSGTMVLDQDLVMDASDFVLKTGLSASFAIDLNTKNLVISNLSNVRFGKTYSVSGFSTSPLQVFVGNYELNDPSKFSYVADRYMIRGNLLLSNGNIAVPQGMSAIFANKATPISYEYNLLENDFRLFGDLHAQLEMPVKYGWLGLVDNLCPQTTLNANLHLHLVYTSAGSVPVLSLNWDDLNVCGKIEYSNILSADLQVSNGSAAYKGFESADLNYKWPSLRMSMNANGKYNGTGLSGQTWSNIQITGGDKAFDKNGTASIANGKNLTVNWNSPIQIFGGTAIKNVFAAYGLDNAQTAEWKWVWATTVDLSTSAFDLPKPQIAYNLFNQTANVSPDTVVHTDPDYFAYQYLNQTNGLLMRTGHRSNQEDWCILANNVGLGVGCEGVRNAQNQIEVKKSDPILSVYRFRDISAPGWSWKGRTILSVNGTSTAAQLKLSQDQIQSCAVPDSWKESYQGQTQLSRPSSLSSSSLNINAGLSISDHNNFLDFKIPTLSMVIPSLVSGKYSMNLVASACGSVRGNSYLRVEDAIVSDLKTEAEILNMSEQRSADIIKQRSAQLPPKMDILGAMQGYPVNIVALERVNTNMAMERTIQGSFMSLSKIEIQGVSIPATSSSQSYQVKASLNKTGVGYLDIQSTQVAGVNSDVVNVLTRTYINDPVTVAVSDGNRTWLLQGLLKGELREKWVNGVGPQIISTSSSVLPQLLVGGESVPVHFVPGTTP